ncbi:MAG: hypothetical protein J6B52_00660 [Clostridia bacterium]|nr:hypothetical protein [Clostridia bacterium]
MKKIVLALVTLICLTICVSACSRNTSQIKETIWRTSQIHVVTEERVTVTEEMKTENQTVFETLPLEETGDGIIKVKHYRHRYYDIPYPFVSLIGKEAYLEWREVQPDPDVSNVMMMVNFVRDFNISREDFDRANNESAWRIKNLLDGVPVMNPQDYANQEDDEVYNADIVYTFDNELINEYYLTPDYPFLYMQEYEEAVENGTYETRTTDFVEVPAEQPMPEIPN